MSEYKVKAVVVLGALFSMLPVSYSMADFMNTAELYEHCLSICGSNTGQGLTMEELPSPDACVGYLKGVSASLSVFGFNDGRIADTKSCASIFLRNRTAKTPSEDAVLMQACNFAEWAGARKSTHKLEAVKTVLMWMRSTDCSS